MVCVFHQLLLFLSAWRLQDFYQNTSVQSGASQSSRFLVSHNVSVHLRQTPTL